MGMEITSRGVWLYARARRRTVRHGRCRTGPHTSPTVRLRARAYSHTPLQVGIAVPVRRVGLDVIPNVFQIVFAVDDVVVEGALPDGSARCAAHGVDADGCGGLEASYDRAKRARWRAKWRRFAAQPILAIWFLDWYRIAGHARRAGRSRCPRWSLARTRSARESARPTPRPPRAGRCRRRPDRRPRGRRPPRARPPRPRHRPDRRPPGNAAPGRPAPPTLRTALTFRPAHVFNNVVHRLDRRMASGRGCAGSALERTSVCQYAEPSTQADGQVYLTVPAWSGVVMRSI